MDQRDGLYISANPCILAKFVLTARLTLLEGNEPTMIKITTAFIFRRSSIIKKQPVWACIILLLLTSGLQVTGFGQAPVNNQWSDSCTSSSFVGIVNCNSNYSFSNLRRVHDYTSGDVIVVGSIRPNLPPNNVYKVYGLVMRITKSGVLKWSRFIGDKDSPYESDTRAYMSLVTKNKDIIIHTGARILRMDGNGNVLWQQEYPNFSSDDLPEEIIETSDGGFLIGGPAFYSATILKMNASGTMEWARTFSMDSYINCRSIVETPGGYYFEGYSYESFDDYSENVLVKMNKQNGDTLWTKSFGKKTFAQYGAEFAYDWMAYQQGKLILTGNTNNNYNGPNKSAQSVVTFDEAGNLLDAKTITNQSVAVQKSSLFRSRLFDMDTRTGVQYDDAYPNDIYLYRLNDQFKQQWAYKFPMLYREEMEDMEVLADSSVVLAGKTTATSPIFTEQALVIKTSQNGMLNNCTNVPFNVVATDAVVNVIPVAVRNGALSYTYRGYPSLPVFDGTGFTWQLLCTNESICRLGKIQGADTICTGSTAVYSILRDGACKNKVSYTATNTTAAFETLSDSSVRIQFNAPGKIVLYASTPANCGLLKDSLVVHVLSSPGAIHLGADTSICEGNSILLNAGDGYVSYKWQDGSGDSAINVQAAGLYYVTATDACGATFQDTIAVIQAPPVDFSVGADRTKCNADTLHLNAPADFSNYSWSPQYNISTMNGHDFVLNPLVDTIYYFKAEKKKGCFVFDTLRISVNHSPPIFLGADTIFCSGQAITLSAGNQFSSYQWNTGQVSSSVTINSAGTYAVMGVFSNGCISRDTILIKPLYAGPLVSLGNDNSLCTLSSRTLSVPAGYKSYLWNDGSVQSSMVVTTLGTYWVNVVDNNGCNAVDTITISRLLSLPSGFLPKDTAICSYGSLDVKPGAGYTSYLWSNNSSAPKITIHKPAVYWLEVTDKNNCVGRDSIVVALKSDCIEGFFAPTAFSPNGDGKNDRFRPLIFGNITLYELTIYNRWGQVVFQTKDPARGWDGLVNGAAQQNAGFIWYCRYQLEGANEQSVKGTVLLVK